MTFGGYQFCNSVGKSAHRCYMEDRKRVLAFVHATIRKNYRYKVNACIAE